MQPTPDLTETLRCAQSLATVLTGCKEGVQTALREAAVEVSKHPSASDPETLRQLLFSTVRRRSLRFPARCELDPPLAELHRQSEPSRSINALVGAANIAPAEAARLLGLDPRVAPLAAMHGGEHTECTAAFQRLATEVSASGLAEELTEKLPHPDKPALFSVRNPANIAVAVGFLLLAATLAWRFTGSAGTFPEEALRIAKLGIRAQASEFAPVEVKLAHVSDWFAIHGYDRFRVPPGFGKFQAVGVRTFQDQGETVAQVAALEDDQRLYFLSFPTVPFDIRVTPEDSWRVTTSGPNALAIRESAGVAFLVTFSGTADEMRNFLTTLRPEEGG